MKRIAKDGSSVLPPRAYRRAFDRLKERMARAREINGPSTDERITRIRLRMFGCALSESNPTAADELTERLGREMYGSEWDEAKKPGWGWPESGSS